MSSGQGLGFGQSAADRPQLRSSLLVQVFALLVVFVLALLILRFLINTICIDLLILRNPESLMRTLSEIRRWFIPWWHPRTQPSGAGGAADVENGNANGTNGNTSRDRDVELVTIDNVLEGLTRRKREEIIASILKSQVASREDLDHWKKSGAGSVASPSNHTDGPAANTPGDGDNNFTGDASYSSISSVSHASSLVQSRRHDIHSHTEEEGQGIMLESTSDHTSSPQHHSHEQQQQQHSHLRHPNRHQDVGSEGGTGHGDTADVSVGGNHSVVSSTHTGVVCSICIQDINVGDSVIVLQTCGHVFHHDCLVSWICTNSRECPNCRQEFITQAMLDEALAFRRRQQF